MGAWKQLSYYEILEITPDAPQNEIHRAYQRVKSTYVPESTALYTMFTREEADELMEQIENAYRVLGNQSLRQRYDASLASRQTVAQALADDPIKYSATGTDHLSATTIDTPGPATNEFVIPEASATLNEFGHRQSFPELALNGSLTITRKDSESSSKTAIGRTKIGFYTVDAVLEEMIQNETEYDGAFFKKVREYKNMSIAQLSEQIRVGKSYLRAIEQDDYSRLPAPVYVRGFILQLSKVLGLDQNKVAQIYTKRFRHVVAKKK